MPQHKASFLDGKDKPFSTRTIETAEPGANEILVKVSALAINPVDWKIQDYGVLIKEWPAILGEDVSGTVEVIGEGVQRFKKGDRVIGHPVYLADQQRKYAGFQEYVVLKEAAASLLPENISFEQGTVLPLAVSTAAAGLFQKDMIGLPLPSAQPKDTGKSILVWGGSSSVGSVAIQLAKAAGVRVVTTCSKRNFDFVKKMGADVAVDYNDPSVVGDLVEALSKGEFAGTYDAIATRDASMQCGQVTAQLGGGPQASVLPPAEDIAASVRAANIFAPSVFLQHKEVGKGVWEDFLPKALASGQFHAAPDAQVVGSGIDAIEDACKKQKAGVSAKKIVVTL